MKGEKTKHAILNQGLAIASVKGLGGITIGMLAQEVGMSKSGLYNHFESKENLQLELLQFATSRFVEEIIAPALKLPRGEPRVYALVKNWLHWAKHASPGGCIFIDAIAEFDDQPGNIRNVVVQSQRDWIDTLATATRIAVEEKHFCPNLDIEKFAYDLCSITYGYNFLIRLLKGSKAEEYVYLCIERLFQDARLSK